MAKLPPKKGEDNPNEWLNTYADMVTLLLTFFVLLFACSNLDETKLQFVYQAFKSRGKYINNIVAEQDPNAESTGGITDNKDNVGGEGTMPQSFDELYVFLSEYVENNNLADMIAVEKGAAHITIRFSNAVFFDGDSYILKIEGKEVLDGMIPAFKAVESSIRKATVSGHTSYGTSAQNDWTLSCLRACSVVNYLEFNNTLSSEKYKALGAGNTEPIASNDTLDGRRQNRRVEMTILKNELDLMDPEVVKDILKYDYGLLAEDFDPDNHHKDDYQNLPEGSVDRIIGFIEHKFTDDSVVTPVGTIGPTAVDGSIFIASTGGESEGGSADE